MNENIDAAERRNPTRGRVLAGAVGTRRRPVIRLGVATALALLAMSAAAPAHARARVFVGGAVGVPGWGYPYPPAYYYYPWYTVPYPGEYPGPPPPAWEPGHWEWRQDPWGRPVRAWVPSHLR